MHNHMDTRRTLTDREVDARATRLLGTLTDDDRARLAHVRSGHWT